MINGKKIDVVAVVTDDEKLDICLAPYNSPLSTGDIIELDGVAGFSEVLFSKSIELGGDEWKVISSFECCGLWTITRNLAPLDWSEYGREEFEFIATAGEETEK